MSGISDLKRLSGYTSDPSPSVSGSRWREMRVIGDQHGTMQVAPTSWLGRKVAAWRQEVTLPLAAQHNQRRAENQAARQLIYNIIHRAEGQTVANAAFRKVLGNNALNSSKPINTRDIRQLIAETEKMRAATRGTNTNKAQRLCSGDNWKQVFQEATDGRVDPSVANDRELKKAVAKAVANHPEFGQRVLSDHELKQIATDAIRQEFANRRAAAEQRFPDLANANLPFVPTHSTFIGQTKALFDDRTGFNNAGPFANQPDQVKNAAKAALDGIREASDLNQKVRFAMNDVRQLRTDIQNKQHDLVNLRATLLQERAQVDQNRGNHQDATDLIDHILAEIDTQSARLGWQVQSLDHTIKNDPFNDKNVQLPRMILADSAMPVFKKAVDKIGEEITSLRAQSQSALLGGHPNRAERLQVKIDELQAVRTHLQVDAQNWYNAQKAAYDNASDQTRSRTPDFYLKGDKTGVPQGTENPITKYTPESTLETIKNICEGAGVSWRIRYSLSASDLKASRLEVMNTKAWNQSTRPITATLNGNVGQYETITTPFGVSGTGVGREVVATNLTNLVPEARSDGRIPINARTIKVEKVNDDGSRKLLMETQQHGINDHFGMEDPTLRALANQNSARQLLQQGIETDPQFVARTLQKAQALALNGAPQPPSRLIYINTNLTTPTWLPRGKGHDEDGYTENQAKSFNANVGPNKLYQVSVANQQNPTTPISVDTEFIDFRVPVNYAQETSGHISDPFMWSSLQKHNEGELQKLVGNTSVGSRIEGMMGDIYRAVEARVQDQNLTQAERTEARELLVRMNTEVDHVRGLLDSRKWQTTGSSINHDRYQLGRHISMMNNAFRMAAESLPDRDNRIVDANGCMSAKDRAGMVGAEAIGNTIINDLGGEMVPGQQLTQEKQDILNKAFLGVVPNTSDVTTFGGSKNAGEAPERINNPDVSEYASGLSEKAKT